jgi:protein-S-isoprenylcysteine O-methyltransferase Ste14
LQAFFGPFVGSFRTIEATPLGGLLLGNVWPAYVFALPLLTRFWALLHMRRGGSLQTQAAFLQQAVIVVFLALVVVLFAVRRRQLQGEHCAPLPGLVALAGTFILNVVAYLPVRDTTSTNALLASSLTVIFGTLWTIWSLTALGRCFGLFAEVRGLVVRGPYRLVRHPVYLGELISALGLLLAKPDAVIFLLVLALLGLQYWRTIFEERALARVFAGEYTAYARGVPRLVPGWR